MKPQIYISHAWGGISEEVVQDIVQAFERRGLEITLDKKDLGYRESITQFMNDLGKADAVIIVVSNKYLRSEYCMYELLQIYEHKNIRDRIFPVVLDEVKIAKSTDRLSLVQYWENQTRDLEKKVRNLESLAHIDGITENLNLHHAIRGKIAGMTNILSDINVLNIDMHRERGFQELYDAVIQKLKETGKIKATGSQKSRRRRVAVAALVILVTVAGLWAGSALLKGSPDTESAADNNTPSDPAVMMDSTEETVSTNPRSSPMSTSKDDQPADNTRQKDERVPVNNTELSQSLEKEQEIPTADGPVRDVQITLARDVLRATVLINEYPIQNYGGSRSLNVIDVQLPEGQHKFTLINQTDTCEVFRIIGNSGSSVTLTCK